MRLFVAAEISEEARAAIARAVEALRRKFEGVRWEGPEKYHFTLKFLGEVGADRLESVTEGVSRASLGVDPFTVRLKGFGSFPPGGNPRVVWIGADEGGAELSALGRRVEADMAALGFAPEAREFHPHVTIGRVRGGGRSGSLAGLREALLARAGESLGGEFRVERVVLLESRLGPGGSRYTLVRAAPLRGGDSGGAGR